MQHKQNQLPSDMRIITTHVPVKWKHDTSLYSNYLSPKHIPSSRLFAAPTFAKSKLGTNTWGYQPQL